MHTRVFIFVNDRGQPCRIIDCLSDRNCCVLESCCCGPCHSLRLQSEHTAEIKSVQVDRITIWCVCVGVCQDANEEPSGADDNGDAEVRFWIKFEELCAASIDLYKLLIRLVREVFFCKLIEDMVELELLYHIEILGDSCFFHFDSLRPYFFGKRRHSLGHLTSFFLSSSRMIASHKLVDRKGTEWNIGLWEDVKHVELQRRWALLSNWKYLKPT